MTEFTPDRLAELKAVAEAATHGSRAAKGSLITTAGGSTLGQAWGINWRHDLRFMAEVSPETVLSLIAALEAKTYEAERLRAMGQGLIKQRDEARAEVEALDREVWRMRALRTEASADRTLEMVEQQRDEARAEVEELRAWQAQTVRRVRDTVASEHVTMLVVEDIPNADYGELIDTLAEQRDDARAEVEELRAALVELAPSAAIVLTEEVVVDGDVFTWGDLPDVLSRTGGTLAEAMRETKDQYIKRRDAEAAIERVREAATEVTNQGDNLGGTHYENCWKYHLHCLAAKIIYETGGDDD